MGRYEGWRGERGVEGWRGGAVEGWMGKEMEKMRDGEVRR